MAKWQFKRFRHPDFLAISQCKVCVYPQARPARYNLSMVCLRSCYMLDTDVIEEMVNVSGEEDFQLTPNQIWYQNSNFVYIGRTVWKSV